VQNNEKGEVTATLRTVAGAAETQTTLSIRAYLHPSQNIAITEISSSSSSSTPMLIMNVTVAVLPLKRLCRTTPNGPTTCQDMDGSTDAGTKAPTGSQSSPTFYAIRQPLGMSSPKPIRVAVANKLVGAAAGGFKCTRLGDTASSCIGNIRNGTDTDAATGAAVTVESLVLATALVTNWDMCHSVAGCGDPLPAALDAVQNVTEATIAQINVANSAWWSSFWAKSWISLPKEPKLEQLFYGQMYLVASASRVDSRLPMAAGLWGPWVHTDNMYCAGCDFTMDYNYMANFWGMYSTNNVHIAMPQWRPVLDFMPRARETVSLLSLLLSSVPLSLLRACSSFSSSFFLSSVRVGLLNE
jgi:hypothetical protein